MSQELSRGFCLSPQQKRLWLSGQRGGAYVAQCVLRVEGPLRPELLREAARAVVARHEVLRTTFERVPGLKTPLQVVQEQDAACWRAAALRAQSETDRRAEVEWHARADAREPFDFERGPLARFSLLAASPEEHALVVTLPSLCADARTLKNLSAALARAYAAALEGVEAFDEPVPYVQFSEWQNELLEGEEGEDGREHWHRHALGGLDVPSLPLEGGASGESAFEVARHARLIGAPLASRLERAAAAQGVAVSDWLLACWQTLLWRLTGQAEAAVAVRCEGRIFEQLQEAFGLYERWPPVRCRLAADFRFAEVLRRAHEAAQEAAEWQEYFSRETLAEAAGDGAWESPVAFEYGEWAEPLCAGGLKLTTLDSYAHTEHFKLKLSCARRADALSLELHYDAARYAPELMALLAARFEALLAQTVEDAHASVASFDVLGDEERTRLLVEWNDTRADFDADRCLHELFEEQAARTPHALALVAGDARLTYAELNVRANQLARRLRSLGVGPESLVGVSLGRSPEMLVGVLGVLKAGGAYVPLDPQHPSERLLFMLEEAGVAVLLTERGRREELTARGSWRAICLDEWEQLSGESGEGLPQLTRPEGLAYVIYTSGSTGRPKGVMITHRSAVNLVSALGAAIYAGQPAPLRVSLNAPLAFDSSVKQLLQLLRGHTLVIVPEDVRADGAALWEFVGRQEVDVLDCTPPQLSLLLSAGWEGGAGRAPALALVGGAAIDETTWWRLAAIGRTRFYNVYGSTECTVDATACLVGAQTRGPSIGRPLANVTAYILDGRMRPAPVGVAGELFVGGEGVGRGYQRQPALTAEKFVPDPFSTEPGARLYRTGDTARALPDGLIEYLGRADDQVKLRGHRIEPGEIEATLRRRVGVEQAVVVLREDAENDQRLVAYLVGSRDTAGGEGELRAFLRGSLPEYMVPSAFVWLAEMPLTPNGKVDRRALPAPGGPDATGGGFAAASTPVEELLAGIWAEVLKVERVGVEDNFFDLGGHSLLLAQVHARVRQAFDANVTMVDLFKYPTVSSLARFIQPEGAEPAPQPAPAAPAARLGGSDVAVIGMAGRFPGARDLEQFWRNLRDGVESVTFFTDEELLASGADPRLLSLPNYVRAGVVLEDVDKFDAMFFGFNPREAEVMDPQHRLFLECAWEAFERAGYDPERAGGPVGVFAGGGPSSYLYNLHTNPDVIESIGEMQLSIGNEKDHLATHVSYKLNLRGPSLAVQTACSTSLVAVHLAWRSLLDGECRMALAGGVTIANYNKPAGYLYQEGGISSPDGHCRAFDAEAHGTIAGSGVGVVLLKRLADALADGDQIQAVIKGSAVNNDGSAKVGYAAPGVEGQAEVIRAAQAAGGVRPETVGYVEAHGTGTLLGDPIEVAALTQVFRASTGEKGFCAIGSLKANIGHTDAAAGVGSFIKTVLSLENRQIPPSLHFVRPNPALGLEEGPFYVNQSLSAWEGRGGPRRAGVSSFGIGGTNAHVVLEEAPGRESSGPSRPWQLLLLSAKTDSALAAASANLARHLREHPESNLADVAYTSQVGRKAFGRRRAVVCRSAEEAAASLDSPDARRDFTSAGEARERRAVFMFPGQGAQHVRMGEGLYRDEPVFREQVDLCCELLKPHLGLDLRGVLYPAAAGGEEAEALLAQTRLTQPALFVVEYALARLWMSWGVSPRAMIGHSLGEYTAACLAGVFSLEDALSLVAFRGGLMQSLPEGAMLSVPLPEGELCSTMGRGLSVAAVNGPALCVVSGAREAVEEFEARLAARGVDCGRLATSHAFHSEMVEPLVGPLVEHVRGLQLNAPRARYVSSATGTWVTEREATDPEYWGRQLRQTVRFADGAREVLQDGNSVLLEVGPGRTLSATVRALARDAGQPAVNSLRHPDEPGDDGEFLARALGRLWLAGVRVDWQALHAGESRRRLRLPTYPFERRRYWVEARPIAASARAWGKAARREPDVADWYYIPFWKPSARPAARGAAGESAAPGPVLVFAGPDGLGARIAERLGRAGRAVFAVRGGARFGRDDGGGYTINLARAEDYDSLLADLKSRGVTPAAVLHALCAEAPGPDGRAPEIQERLLLEGFYSLTLLARALARHDAEAKVSITVLSDCAHRVTGGERVVPERAAALGPCRVIPLEYPNLACRSIDIALPARGGGQEERLVSQLVSELASDSADAAVAYREGRRWVQAYEPVRLAQSPPAAAPLKEAGVYLITGGLEGVGLLMARQLARALRAKLVLTSPRALPRREDWERLLSDGAGGDAALAGVREVLAMEEDGAEVLALAADAADASQMREAVRLARVRFGRIDGVIHAAGAAGDGAGGAATAAEAARVLAPKVRGARVLEELFAEEPPDFVALFSSLASLTGSAAGSDVCAAGAFLDAFAHYNSQTYGTPTVAVSWDAWRGAGGGAQAHGAPAEGISPEEGFDAFARVLADGPPAQVVVSTIDLETVIRRAAESARPAAGADSARAQQSPSAHPRPEMQVAYLAPRDDLEERIAGLWQSVLGLDRVGVNDNFFELGGHSLLATRLVSHLRELLRAEIPLRVVFEKPTVAGLAEHIAQGAASEAAQPPPAIVPVARQARRSTRPRKQ